ncbi:hypothetical protein O988_04399 [Pseudogymnoascus sp. VKM F-3808]|nr:hypothetical protein O988_04399 [Pseudogymnoascus sp. VKM F-3808]
MEKNSSILIVGGGTWGLSSALHLARRGYNNVTIFDPYPIPSPISAGNDVNKIVDHATQSTHSDESYVGSILFHATISGWREDPVFKPFYYETGTIFAASSAEGEAGLKRRENPDHAEPGTMTRLNTPEDFKRLMKVGALTGDFPGWRGWHKKGTAGSGFVNAKNTMISAAAEAKSLGVKFVTGVEDGHVVQLTYSNSNVTGVKTKNGLEHHADCTILSAGAMSDQIFDTEGQLLPKCWTLMHIKLTDAEVEIYRDNPVMYNTERGFFIPDLESKELKICNEFPGYTNFSADSSGRIRSVPVAREEIPIEAEERARAYLRECMPHLAERPFSFARICWCADTPDRSFLIGRHPTYTKLLLASGDSGRSFMHIPSIGGFIVDSMEGILDPIMANAWRWRPETAIGRDVAAPQGRAGGIGKPEDLRDVKGWTDGKATHALL